MEQHEFIYRVQRYELEDDDLIKPKKNIKLAVPEGTKLVCIGCLVIPQEIYFCTKEKSFWCSECVTNIYKHDISDNHDHSVVKLKTIIHADGFTEILGNEPIPQP